jgi:adenine-specific DNA-methyltransferase
MTELIWDGKYVDGKKQSPVRVALPFQTIETVNESTADRQRTLEMFSSGRETEWRNRLIWGDKKYVLPSLLPEFAGKVNLVYIDPPFDTGADFSFIATVPHHSPSEDEELTSFLKEPSVIEQKAYRDTWGRGLDSYLQWFLETATFLRELMHESGSLYVHLDYNVGHYAKVILDEVFGSSNFRNEIVWQRTTSRKGINQLGRVHDVIYFYTKANQAAWHPPSVPQTEDNARGHDFMTDADGTIHRLSDLTGAGAGSARVFKGVAIDPPRGRHWAYDQNGIDDLMKRGRIAFSQGGKPRLKTPLSELKSIALHDVWTDITALNSAAEERMDYPTQKPEALLERIIEASSNTDDLVLDCFAGSGTTAAAAEKLRRRWITCDLGRFAIHTTRKRLLAIPSVKPFVVQNLGKYERQAWQAAEFPSNRKDHLEEQRERESAYRKFILDLYRAAPITGQTWLHGVKGGRMVHVGAVDAPVTISDVKAIAREVWKAASGASAKAAVDILGWEFALELNETARNVAAESRVDVAFKKIPREVLEKKAVEQGDVKFFELGALSVDLKEKKREVTIKLSDFVIPLDDVPEEARKAVKHWSQMVDYWAVDWDFKEDTFHNQWQSYRTRKEQSIELHTKYEYAEPGKYRIVVKVIDILGNDTTKTLDISVK